MVYGSFSVSQNPLEGLSTHRVLSPTTTASVSVGLRWNLRICISEFPDNADAADLGATLLQTTGILGKEFLTLSRSHPLICSNRFIH